MCSKVSIKRLVLLNAEKIRPGLFIYYITFSINHAGLDFWKKSLLNDQYYIYFSNSRSLEQLGLIMETLEYERTKQFM